jgi:hypothetical protein
MLFSVENDFGAEGASGIMLYWKVPWSCVFADIRGLMGEPLTRLSEISAWGNNLSHRLGGRLRLVLLIPAMT